MSHKTVYVSIPAREIAGNTDQNHISRLVQGIMSKYVEGTAQDGNIKCDWYEIGGRWEGTFGAIKGTENVLPAGSGSFAYELFGSYNLIVNNGQQGPYFAGETEYIPINGGLKKDIAWDAIEKLEAYTRHRFFEWILNRDPRIEANIDEDYLIVEDGLYFKTDGEPVLILKRGETFEERNARLGQTFGKGMLSVDAYVDKNGVWHDEDNMWRKFFIGGSKNMPEDPETAAKEELMKSFRNFLDEELEPDDYVVVLDCHCFP